MRAAARFLDRISARLNRMALVGAVASVMALVVIAAWQVVARYILAQPPAWTEELARFMMVWAGLLGASVAFRAQADPSLFPAARDRRGGLGRFFAAVRTLGVLAFVIPIVWFCAFSLRGDLAGGYIGRSLNLNAETMELPMVIFAAAVPVGFVLILIHAVAQGAMLITGADD